MTLSDNLTRAVKFAGASILLSFSITASHAASAVIQWNRIAVSTTTGNLGPVRDTRVLAMTHIAIHDALNAIDRRYAPYAWDRVVGDASVEGAVATAYQQALANIQRGDAKEAGIRIGHRSAEVILQRRENDGSARESSVRAGTQPGEYRPTPPDLIPAFLPDWGRVQPFAMRNGQQFRPEAPYKLNTRDYSEVLTVGDGKSTVRSDEGSQVAEFWYEDSSIGWNRIAVDLADAQSSTTGSPRSCWLW